MQHQNIPNPPSDANAAAEVAGSRALRTDPPYIDIPADVLISMSASLIDTQRAIIAERDREIRVLHALLRLAADMFIPPNVVIQ